MRIEIAAPKNASEKEKGDLLEKLSGDFLLSQNYDVETEVKRTGIELDLICKNKANPSKKIYIECKAYSDNKNIQADVIKNIIAAKSLYHYAEVWLVLTTELGKEAKGLVDKLEEGDDRRSFTFYTPKKLIEALVASKTINNLDLSLKAILEKVKDENRLGKSTLLVTQYGNFWATEYLDGGKATGVIFTYANNSKIIIEEDLLKNIHKLNSTFKKLNVFVIFELIENEKVSEISIKDLSLNNEYLNQINDIGIKFTHPSKEDLTLDDIFIYPDLENIQKEEEGRIISSNLFDQEGCRRAIIFGDDVSGKTSLAFSLQKESNATGYISIYLDAEDIKKPDIKRFSNLLINKFHKQYSDKKHFSDYFKIILARQVDKILLLIDNLEICNLKEGKEYHSFFEMLKNEFPNFLIFANRSMEIELLAQSENRKLLEGIKTLRIRPFGHLLKSDLVSKWLSVGAVENLSDNDIFSRKDEIVKKLDVIVGTNFVPTYPLYLLTMLQGIEAGHKTNLHNTSYADLYRYLINQALSRANISGDDHDLYITYLSSLAYFLFAEKKKKISQNDLISFYTNYAKHMDLVNGFDNIHEPLLRAKILKKEKDLYSFSHNYSYYFFVAKYFSDKASDKKIKAQVKEMSEKLYRTEYANIFLFLIYHSKNWDLIKKILQESKQIFRDAIPFTLSEIEVSDLNKLIQGGIKILIDDGDPSERRREVLQHRDEIEDETRIKEEETKETHLLDLIGKINLSFKLIEILGQITNNFYGSFDAEKKSDVLEEIHSLGFKALKSLLGDVVKYIETIQNEVKKNIDKKGGLLEHEKKIITNKIVFNFTSFIIGVFVKKISDSIASKNLFVSIDKITEKWDNPSAKLVNIAAKLNFPGELKVEKIMQLDRNFKDNFMAKRLLTLFVIDHLYRFKVDPADKQKICNQLGIDTKKNKGIYQGK
jgi:hypothetical protein